MACTWNPSPWKGVTRDTIVTASGSQNSRVSVSRFAEVVWGELPSRPSYPPSSQDASDTTNKGSSSSLVSTTQCCPQQNPAVSCLSVAELLLLHSCITINGGHTSKKCCKTPTADREHDCQRTQGPKVKLFQHQWQNSEEPWKAPANTDWPPLTHYTRKSTGP